MAECVVYVYNVLLFFVCYVYLVDFAIAETLAHVKPAAEFSRHTLIKAKIYHGREKRQITSTNNGKIGVDFLTVHYDIDNIQHVLDLRLNKDLLPSGYFRKYQKNGKHVIETPRQDEVDLCHYQGKVRGIPDSWAAISTCQGGLKGVVFDGKELNHIDKAHDNYDGFGDLHYLYKHSDLIETNNKSCGYDGGAHEHFHSVNDNKILTRFKRSSNPAGYIRGPYNANKRSRYVELVLVVDNREYKDLGESLTRVYLHCKDISNIINGLYSSLNIFIALVGIVVWTEHDEIDLSPNGDTTLTNFLHYRREKLIKEHPNDNAQLLTKYVFDRGVVGKALKGPICTFEYSGGVSMDHSVVTSLVATTVAHEMGHNFGMEHDTNDCECPEERCIMAPSSSASWPTHWSSCSLEYLALAFEHGMDYCLRNKPLTLFDSPVCGNGFVEAGEQCDCGLPQTCDNTCCNATTCMLFSNASCATGECCNLKTCHPKTAGSLCRAADYECDLPEYCTGQSEYCPTNIFKMDTEDCDGGKAFCYQGSCRTRSDQCKLLWGNTGKSSDDQCYTMNTKGSRHGNCGYHRVNQSFIKCDDENILCGMLHCRHLNERLEFGMESVAILSQSFINLKGLIIPCRTAIVDLGLNQVDPGLAPDGASCGEGKMCVNQKCMSVDSLRAMKNKCPQDCNGNGICNSLGHCHCKDGFSPPFCDYPGPGGSEDSGPASDPNARKEFVMAMYIVFLGIIPIIAILAFLMYYTKYNVNFKWQKTNGSTNKSLKSPPKLRNGTAFSSESAKRMDDDSSLLQDHQTSFQNEFFGQFKGFRLTPLTVNEDTKQTKRVIPTVPSVPTIPNVTIKNPRAPRSNNNTPIAMVKPEVRSTSSNETKQLSVAGAVVSANATSIAPALPPLNPGSNPRPLISSPILKASTCTAKELLSPLKSAPKIPTRPAPDAPENPRPLSSPVNVSVAIILDDVPVQPKPKETTSTLNRIASFLKSKDDKNKSQSNSPSATQNIAKLNKTLDKNALRTIEISSPIPQSEIGIIVNDLQTEGEKQKAVVMRAQSMRGSNVTPRPAIQTFGSMRQPNGAKRPTSIPVGNRPKSPPPPRPPLPEIETNHIVKIPGLPGYQEPSKTKPVNGKTTDYQYDDCMNEAPLAKISEEVSPNSGDNIYAVIEETPKSISSGKSSSDSTESVGLLGEIVSEIQNRNFDSIYSTSTLARKKKEALEMEKLKSKNKNDGTSDPSETYVNTSSFYKTPDSVYSNMGNMNQSSASSTASGYIHPSAVNAPTKPIINNDKKILSPKNNLSTFKTDNKPDISSYKPFHSTLQRSAGPFASSFKTTPITVDKKPESTFKTPIIIPIDKKIETTFKTPVNKPEITFKSPVISTVDKPDSTFKSPVDKKPESTFKSTIVSPDKKLDSTFKSPIIAVHKKPEATLKTPTSPVDKKIESTFKLPVDKKAEFFKTPVITPVEKKPEISEVKNEVTSPNSTSKAPKPVGRQVTPVNLRTRKSSPSRNVISATPKNITPTKSAVKTPATSNSPDLVISCSTTTTPSTKSPDVLNSSAKINNKPNGVLPKPVSVTTKTVPVKTVKSPTERKPVGKSPVATKHLNKINSDVNKVTNSVKIPAKIQPSNVATLQQKFENKTPVSTKTK